MFKSILYLVFFVLSMNVFSQVNVYSIDFKKSISLLEDSLRSWGFDIQEIDDEIGVLNATKYIISNNGSM